MLRRLHRDRRGASAVEFALVLPVLLTLLFGTLEVGRLMWVRSTMQFAAEEATRYALVHTGASVAEITALARARVAASVSSLAPQVTVTSTATTVTVQLNQDVPLVSAGLLPVRHVALSAISRLPRN